VFRIHFTQFIGEDGGATPVSFDRPADIHQKARTLTLAGYHFEIMLTHGRYELECLSDHHQALGEPPLFRVSFPEKSAKDFLGGAVDAVVTGAWSAWLAQETQTDG
jgi:hypothetical protein